MRMYLRKLIIPMIEMRKEAAGDRQDKAGQSGPHYMVLAIAVAPA